MLIAFVRSWIWIALFAGTLPLSLGAQNARRTENVILITIDGLRWQEVFTGAEALLLNKTNGGVVRTNRVAAFWRDTPEERRAALLPFFWTTIAREGQLFGNQHAGSVVRVTNGRNFTYPGFNEILTGYADDRIKSNAKQWNPNVTMLEWLHRKPAFTNRVVAVANWDVFPYILNTRRSGIPMWTGYETNPPAGGPRLGFIQQLWREATPVWPDMNFDVFYFHAAAEQFRALKPRVAWVAFSETDEWAHEGRYDLYLLALQRIDGYIRALWELLQSMPEYRGKTSLLLTCDHGRGSGPLEWKNHGAAVPGAENIWIAALGPDTRGLGERREVPPLGQNQIAATLAAWLGGDYLRDEPRAGAPIADLLPAAKARP